MTRSRYLAEVSPFPERLLNLTWGKRRSSFAENETNERSTTPCGLNGRSFDGLLALLSRGSKIDAICFLADNGRLARLVHERRNPGDVLGHA